ncbi:MAG: type II toxin-antitoxin system VapC family toxin [Candidatus Hydrogenedentes bacterium]|nr:type II toxin-antitoxin system VapC family toxin [Candidatus Hydrogenedentota bacterium]
MKGWFADTSFFVALLSPKDNIHSVAMRHVGELRNRRLVTSTWVLMELGNACSPPRRRHGFRQILHFLKSQPVATIFDANPLDYARGVDLYLDRMDKSWSLTDCISFVIMSDHGLTEALTSDRHFEQAGFTALLASN